MIITNIEEAFTVKEICDRFKVSERTVRNKIKAGELKAKKITPNQQGQWRVSAASCREVFLG